MRKLLNENTPQASSFLNQAINGDLVPINFETKGQKLPSGAKQYKTIDGNARGPRS